MANSDTPQGLKPFGEIKRIGYYKKDASAAAIFDGTPVMMETDGYIIPATAAGANILGVSAKYSAASTADSEMPVYDHPDQRFVVQDDAAATLTQAAVGANADITAESGNTTTGKSTVELSAATLASTAASLRIIEVAPTIYPDGTVNALGNWCDWIVEINEHALRTTSGI